MIASFVRFSLGFSMLVTASLLPCGVVLGDQSDFLNQHCAHCHDTANQSGGLNLEAIKRSPQKHENLAMWVKIHDRIAANEMPPRDESQPSEKEKRAFLRKLADELHRLDAQRLNVEGRVRLRRLTRQEFENALRDLLLLPQLDIVSLLPADGRVAGYHKIASGLDLSPSHLAAYEEAIEKALDMAIATRSTPPPVYKKRVYPAGLFKFGANLTQGQFVLLRDKQPDSALPVRGGFEDKQGYVGDDGPDLADRQRLLQAVRESNSQSAVGLLNPNLAGYEAAMNVAPIYSGNYQLKISLWGFRWNAGRPEPSDAPQAAALRAHEEGKQQEGGRLLRLLTAPSMESKEVAFSTWLHERESIVFDPVSVPWNGLRIGQVAGRAAKHIGPGVAIDWFEIEGPINKTWPPESHQRLFGDLPIKPLPKDSHVVPPRRQAVRGLGGYLPNFHTDIPPHERKPALETVQSDDPIEDAQRLLAGFLPRAFRRDVNAVEIAPYLVLLRERLVEQDCFEDAMRRVYVAVLTSPEFLFHAADCGAGNRSSDNELDETNDHFTLASRLSFWLWNGPPDDELLDKARKGLLMQSAELRSQIDRMLADRRSERFIDDFSNQWLELHRLGETTPDPKLYPEYRFLLHEGLVAEPRAFLRELIDHDLPITSLVKPNFAMLTQRLAEHYGIKDVHGVEVRKVPLPIESVRGGLLGQAAIHKLTANGTTTTPVKRGVWVMDRLLDQPAPPPPPGISAVDPDTRGTTTIREQLDRHRADASCAACHAKIDPPGFALEAFDPIGGLRTRYRSSGQGDEPPEKSQTDWRVQYKLGPPVDATGELVDGRRFRGPSEMAELMIEQPETLAFAFVQHLSRYATGADISFADRVEIRRIVDSTRDSDYGIRSLVHAFAQSPLFLSMKVRLP